MLIQENDYLACKEKFLQNVTYTEGPVRYFTTSECLYDYVCFIFNLEYSRENLLNIIRDQQNISMILAVIYIMEMEVIKIALLPSEASICR